MRTAATKTIAGKINQDGTVAQAIGGTVTCNKTATGAYAMTFPGQRLISAAFSTMLGGPLSIIAMNWGGSNIGQVSPVNASGAAVDAPFTFAATVAA